MACGLTNLANAKLYLGIPESDSTKDDLLLMIIDQVENTVERYCNRTFASTSYTKKRYNGKGSAILQFEDYPVTAISRIATNTYGVFLLNNTSTDASHATVAVSTTGITLVIVGGVNAGTDTLLFADHTTLGTLDDAVVALGKNWTATTSSGYIDKPATELMPIEAQFVLNNSTTLEIPGNPISSYILNSNGGEVYYYAGFTSGYGNIIVDYTAGYAIIPYGLELAVLQLVAFSYNLSKRDPTLKSEELGDYSWTAASGGTSASVAYNIPINMLADVLSPWQKTVVI